MLVTVYVQLHVTIICNICQSVLRTTLFCLRTPLSSCSEVVLHLTVTSSVQQVMGCIRNNHNCHPLGNFASYMCALSTNYACILTNHYVYEVSDYFTEPSDKQPGFHKRGKGEYPSYVTNLSPKILDQTVLRLSELTIVLPKGPCPQ